MMSFFDDAPASKTSGPIISKSKKPLPPKSRPVLSLASSSRSSPGLKPLPSDRRPSRPSPASHKSNGSPGLHKKRKTEQRVESESSSDESVDPPIQKHASAGTDLATGGGANGERWKGGRWVFEGVDERGEWGRGWGGFVTSEEAMRGVVRGWAGEGKPPGSLDRYVPYFPQEGFEKEHMPSVELQYPAPGCRERFFLLAPTSAREYSPIGELRTALRTILDFYIPASHHGIFGTLSDSLDLEATSTVATPIASRDSPLPPSVSTPPLTPSGASSPTPHANGVAETIGDALRKALAPNRRDGPAFLRAMQRFNDAMADIQSDGSLKRHLEALEGTLDRERWSGIVDVVHEQAYSRVVGPYSNELEHHPKHPDEVARAISAKEDAYGELRHKFMQRVIEQTGLGPKHVFVDLGSGVGNCVVQAALEAGSRSYGFELLPVPAHCARLQLRETQRRWAMWCLEGNLGVEVHEGDFRTHPQVAKRLREADVVLVNNEVFPPSLNADLTNLFLDLKEGAKIVSLKPFVPETFKMTESNCDSFAAIVRMSQHSYYRDWVSWKGDSGTYYLQVIDRSTRLRFEEEMNGRRRR